MTRTRRSLAAALLTLGLGAGVVACGDDDEERTPGTGETGVDGGESDAGDPTDDTLSGDDGGDTGTGTEGNQELDTPTEQGDTPDTARGDAG